MMSCNVQISLDLHTIEDALNVADIAVQCGVDWLEAGTGLMVEQGLHVVTALRAKYPHHPILFCAVSRYAMEPVISPKSLRRQALPTST
jgi:3-keto-L-gulonate-6-phosphate decarboxylase